MNKDLKQTKYKIELETLKSLCQENFSNRVFFALTGLEDFLNDEKLKHHKHFIDFAFLNAVPELRKERKKPSKALAVMAFNGVRDKDYEVLVKESQSASVQELKEFLDLEIEINPKEKVANYLTFPLLAMMTAHLNPKEKAALLLGYPELIKQCFKKTRSKTFSELLSVEDKKQMEKMANLEMKSLFEIDYIPTSWKVPVSSGLESALLDLRTVQALGRWPIIRENRQKSKQTGVAAKLKEWEQKHTQTRAIRIKAQKTL